MSEAPIFVSSFLREGSLFDPNSSFSSKEDEKSVPAQMVELTSPLHFIPDYETRDLHSEAAVPYEVLRRLQMMSGEWAIITLSSQGDDQSALSSRSSRLVRIFGSPPSLSPSLPSVDLLPTVCCAPSLFFSLIKDSRNGCHSSFSLSSLPSCVVVTIERSLVTFPPLSLFASLPIPYDPETPSRITVATSLTLSVVSSPLSVTKMYFERLLHRHFRSPRVLAKGDVIALRYPFQTGKSFSFEWDESSGEESDGFGADLIGEGDAYGEFDDPSLSYSMEGQDGDEDDWEEGAGLGAEQEEEKNLKRKRQRKGENEERKGRSFDVTDIVLGHRHSKYVYFCVEEIHHLCRSDLCKVCSSRASNGPTDGREQIDFYIVDSRVTAIRQKGKSRSFVPRQMEPFLENCSCDEGPSLPLGLDGPTSLCRRIFESPSDQEDVLLVGKQSNWDPSREGPIKELVKTVRPFFHPLGKRLFPYPSPVLLTSPIGSGKTELVHQLGKKLNVHMMEINCTELIDSNPKKIQENLLSVTLLARYSSPCILLLKNISCLEKPHQISQNGIGDAKATSPLAEWLRSMFRVLSPSSSSSSSDLKATQTTTEEGPYPVLVIATISDSNLEDMSADVRSFFHFEISIPSLDAEKRESFLSLLTSSLPLSSDVMIDRLASETASLSLSHLDAVISDSFHQSILSYLEKDRESSSSLFPSPTSKTASLQITNEQIRSALAQVRKSQSRDAASKGVSGTASIPTVNWEDVGGLSAAKKEIIDTIQLPLKFPNLFASGMKRRSGILLFGPPGTGKTLLAKAVATECSLNFMSVKGPELVNMYVGQSEKNVRDVFFRARAARPCVIFFDELDSLAPNRGKSGDSGGVMDRVVSQLLAEVDGLDSANDVFVIGATNRPDLLDTALLRPGRFDRLVYLGVSETKEAQKQILKAVTRKMTICDAVKLDQVAGLCPMTFTGADFQAVCSDALRLAIRHRLEEVEGSEKEEGEGEGEGEGEKKKEKERSRIPGGWEEEEGSGEEKDGGGGGKEDKKKKKVVVKLEHFESAIKGVTPSVSESDLEYYKGLQRKHSVQQK